MSKYLTWTHEWAFTDRDLLVKALERLGYTDLDEAANIPLVAFDGQLRQDDAGRVVTADLVVRRRYVGRSSNDLGFTRTEGGYVPQISEFDRGFLARKHGVEDFAVALRVAYNEAFIEEAVQTFGGQVLGAGRVGSVQTITVSYA